MEGCFFYIYDCLRAKNDHLSHFPDAQYGGTFFALACDVEIALWVKTNAFGLLQQVFIEAMQRQQLPFRGIHGQQATRPGKDVPVPQRGMYGNARWTETQAARRLGAVQVFEHFLLAGRGRVALEEVEHIAEPEDEGWLFGHSHISQIPGIHMLFALRQLRRGSLAGHEQLSVLGNGGEALHVVGFVNMAFELERSCRTIGGKCDAMQSARTLDGVHRVAHCGHSFKVAVVGKIYAMQYAAGCRVKAVDDALLILYGQEVFLAGRPLQTGDFQQFGREFRAAFGLVQVVRQRSILGRGAASGAAPEGEAEEEQTGSVQLLHQAKVGKKIPSNILHGLTVAAVEQVLGFTVTNP